MKLKRKRKITLAISLLLYIVGGIVRSYGFELDIEDIEKWVFISKIGSYIQMIGFVLFFLSLFMISKDLNSEKISK
ncbi:hypothetical protein [Tenacibaculum sp. E3R01]|uniref:hypothetical protein n=1 Tax=Tenacibaculum TaxID=104267 RepID=UPI000DE940CA|nr:hypothetical protein [Tenacibaculum sp. E3R01]RBW56719.1 hypothetical protein DS884_14780 [Tenacibaculum sp. E3R01]